MTNQSRPRRADFQHPYLEPSVALGRRREEVEDVASYAHKLTDSEKAWMNQFMKEWNDAAVGSEEEPTGVFHRTKEERKICTDRNNERNRCDYTIAKAMDMLHMIEDDYELEKILHTDPNADEVEDHE